MYAQQNTGKKKNPKDKIDFEKKLKEAFKTREEKIENLEKQMLDFLVKNQIDDRDAKSALRGALKKLKARCELDKV